MTVEQVVEEVSKDLPFYLTSGGGVTLSGGEATMQTPFVASLLEACHERGIHTAMETCGQTSWANFTALLPHLDQLLYDIKAMDPAVHVRLTGVPNHRILDNLRRLAGNGVDMTIRQVVIPGHNDSEEALHQLGEFVIGLAGTPPVELLPYHGYGIPKYEQLGRSYSLHELEPPTQKRMLHLRDLVRGHGARCDIV
jgi:pyruvate formate lyase activating enzyme